MYNTAIISDNKQIRALSEKFLTHFNPEIAVSVSETLSDFIKHLYSDKYVDVLIIDHGNDIQFEKVINELSRSNINLPIILISHEVDPKLMSDVVNNHVDNYLFLGAKDPSDYFSELSNLIVYAIERNRRNHQREIESKRNLALVELAKMGPFNFPSIVNYALDKAIELTESELGYVSTYDKKTKKLTMLAWSQSAMARCGMKNYPMEFDLNLTGIWGVPVLTGQSLIINDYQTTTHPMKNGVPHGHVSMNKLLMVPIYLDGELIATAGVANKVRDYTSFDEMQLQLMIQEMYKIERSITQKNKFDSEMSILNDMTQKGPVGLAFVSKDGKIAFCNQVARECLDIENKELPLDLDSLTGPLINGIKDTISNYRNMGYANKILNVNNKTWSLTTYGTISSNIEGFDIILTDITEITEYKNKIEREKHHTDVIDKVVLESLMIVQKELKDSECYENDPKKTFAYKKLKNTVDFLDKYNKLSDESPQWLSLKNIVFSGIIKEEHEIEIDASLDGVNVFASRMFSDVFYQLKKISCERSDEVTAIKIRYKIQNGNLTIVCTDNGVHMHQYSRRALGSLPVNGLSFVLIKKICEELKMNIHWYPAIEGMHVEITIPSDRYTIGE